MAEVFANSEDPDQTPRSAASDLGLHSLAITMLGVSRLQWVKMPNPLLIYSQSDYLCQVADTNSRSK